MKIYALAPNENWICDRFVKEWNENNPELVATSPYDCDILWILAGWCWNHIDYRKIDKTKTKVLVTVHHLVPENFNNQKSLLEWQVRDQIADAYHVPCEKTKEQIQNLTEKPIYTFPFWTNDKMWHSIDRDICRSELNLPNDKFIIGSFQRDTLGSDLISPKLEKGPDILADTIITLSRQKDVHVLLGGWRRQYIIKRLEDAKIEYTYNELPDFSTLNKMYNSLDLYLVTSRYEGGPQAIVECGLSKTPLISTNVGLAKEILNPNSYTNRAGNILTCMADIEWAYNCSKEISINEKGFDPFYKMFSEIK
tara:strand:- start:365 stop:1291 length:927 start_codon:yes stop_codon:yes gene_type:complete